MRLLNCTFTGNTATYRGGAVCNIGISPTVSNSILWGDTAGESGNEIHDDTSTPVVSYSIVQGGYAAGTNMIVPDAATATANIFLDAPNGDYHLASGSPAIDVGNGCATGVTMTDKDGNSRWDIAAVTGSTSALDLGAYEYQGTTGTDSLISAFTCP